MTLEKQIVKLQSQTLGIVPLTGKPCVLVNRTWEGVSWSSWLQPPNCPSSPQLLSHPYSSAARMFILGYWSFHVSHSKIDSGEFPHANQMPPEYLNKESLNICRAQGVPSAAQGGQWRQRLLTAHCALLPPTTFKFLARKQLCGIEIFPASLSAMWLNSG